MDDRLTYQLLNISLYVVLWHSWLWFCFDFYRSWKEDRPRVRLSVAVYTSLVSFCGSTYLWTSDSLRDSALRWSDVSLSNFALIMPHLSKGLMAAAVCVGSCAALALWILKDNDVVADNRKR